MAFDFAIPDFSGAVPDFSGAGSPEDLAQLSAEFQLEMFAVNVVHASANSMIQTSQGIADRVAQT